MKVAAAVQVEGAAVQVAGRCASGMQATVQVEGGHCSSALGSQAGTFDEQAHVVLARPTAP